MERGNTTSDPSFIGGIWKNRSELWLVSSSVVAQWKTDLLFVTS
jgi:hypothetical protein